MPKATHLRRLSFYPFGQPPKQVRPREDISGFWHVGAEVQDAHLSHTPLTLLPCGITFCQFGHLIATLQTGSGNSEVVIKSNPAGMLYAHYA